MNNRLLLAHQLRRKEIKFLRTARVSDFLNSFIFHIIHIIYW